MDAVFYISALVALAATALMITRTNAVHALLYLILSLLSVAVIFFVLGAPFAAVLEVIIYAGAIMVLFIFVIMMLNLGGEAQRQERQWLNPRIWWGPSLLTLILLLEVVYILYRQAGVSLEAAGATTPQEVGALLYGPYLIAVELAALLLMAGTVGAYHLGRRGSASGIEEGEV